jgi:hypothetical protein
MKAKKRNAQENALLEEHIYEWRLHHPIEKFRCGAPIHRDYERWKGSRGAEKYLKRKLGTHARKPRWDYERKVRRDHPECCEQY